MATEDLYYPSMGGYSALTGTTNPPMSYLGQLVNRSILDDAYVDAMYARTSDIDLDEDYEEDLVTAVNTVARAPTNTVATNEQKYSQYVQDEQGILRRGDGQIPRDITYERMHGDRLQAYNDAGLNHMDDVTYSLMDPYATGRPTQNQVENDLARSTARRRQADARLEAAVATLQPDKPTQEPMAAAGGFRLTNYTAWRRVIDESIWRADNAIRRPDGTYSDSFIPKNVPLLTTSRMVGMNAEDYEILQNLGDPLKNIITPVSAVSPGLAKPLLEQDGFVGNGGRLDEQYSMRGAHAVQIVRAVLQNANEIDISTLPDVMKGISRAISAVRAGTTSHDVTTDRYSIEQLANVIRAQLNLGPPKRASERDGVLNEMSKNESFTNTSRAIDTKKASRLLDVMMDIRVQDQNAVKARRVDRAVAGTRGGDTPVTDKRFNEQVLNKMHIALFARPTNPSKNEYDNQRNFDEQHKMGARAMDARTPQRMDPFNITKRNLSMDHTIRTRHVPYSHRYKRTEIQQNADEGAQDQWTM